jgi:hypothetical protein
LSKWKQYPKDKPAEYDAWVLFYVDEPDDPHCGSYADGNFYCEMRQCDGDKVENVQGWVSASSLDLFV